jgi:hypothetical protein
MLSFSPSLAVRLLRHEVAALTSEATLVHFIQESQRRQETFGPTSSQDSSILNPIWLLGLVPKLLKHSSNNREMAYPYSIFEAVPGTPVSMIPTALAISERKLLDKQTGIMARSLASLTSPPGTFGQVSKVLPNPFKSAAPAVTGFKTWSEAFNSLLEGIMQDGEDMSILLPYEDIRRHYQNHQWLLDEVTIPRLTLLDLGNDANIMIERNPAQDPSSPSAASQEIRLTGLRSWSQGIFGDPLIADCFSSPTPEFLAGWHAEDSAEKIIENEANAEVRMLLYGVFRSVVGIVTEHYRSQVDSGKRELEWRRNLTSTLKELEKVPEESSGSKRPRSSPAETIGKAKRLKFVED